MVITTKKPAAKKPAAKKTAAKATAKKTAGKKKIASKAKAKGKGKGIGAAALRELVTNYVARRAKLESAERRALPVRKAVAEMEAMLRGHAEEHPALEPVRLAGDEHEVILSACPQLARIPDVNAVYHMLYAIDADLPFALMKFDIGDLRKYLTPEQLDKVLETAAVGKRRIKVEPI